MKTIVFFSSIVLTTERNLLQQKEFIQADVYILIDDKSSLRFSCVGNRQHHSLKIINGNQSSLQAILQIK